jgi:asparagine synthase (glutamine-hydrolysing)
MDEISKILPEKNAPFNKVWLFRKFLKSMENKELLRSYISTVSFFDLPEKEEIKSNKFKSLTSTELPYNYLKNFFDVDGDLIKKMTYTDFNSYLPECLMMKMDIASMANSLETRSPLLDHILVEFTQTLPSDYKMKFFETKYIFKDTFKEMLPNQIKRRGKKKANSR